MVNHWAPYGDTTMSASKKPRSECAKDSASGNGASKKASAGGRKDGKGKAGTFAKDSALDVRAVIQFELLADDASHEQREVYIKKHAVAVKGARRKELKHSWCIGREIPTIKAEKDLNNNEADAYFKATFGFGVRQGNNYEQLWQAFPSIEEMLKNVPESASLSVAVDKARSLIDPGPEPDSDSPTDDMDDDGKNTRTRTESGPNGGIGEKPPPVAPPPLPNSGDEFSILRDDIVRLVTQMEKEYLPVLRKIHGLVTKAVASKNGVASGMGRGASNGKSKSRKGS